MEKLQNHFIINAAALSSQLMRDYDVTDSKGNSVPLEIGRIRKFFFDILDGRVVIKEIDGNIDFEELKQKFGH